MREVAEVAGKDPGADPRRLSNRGDAAGRPSEAGVFARLDDMPARHRAGRPPLLCFVKFLWAVSAFLLVRLSGCF